MLSFFRRLVGFLLKSGGDFFWVIRFQLFFFTEAFGCLQAMALHHFFKYPWDPCLVLNYIYHEIEPNASKYAIQ